MLFSIKMRRKEKKVNQLYESIISTFKASSQWKVLEARRRSRRSSGLPVTVAALLYAIYTSTPPILILRIAFNALSFAPWPNGIGVRHIKPHRLFARKD